MSVPLRVRGLRAGYGGVAVVHDVDLEVAEGEVLALLGANGAGKTTTLLAISGRGPDSSLVTSSFLAGLELPALTAAYGRIAANSAKLSGSR